MLGPPAATAVSFNRIIARTSTTDLAYRWILANAPEGSRIVQEGNHLTFPPRYESHRLRQLRQLTYDQHVASGADYLIASSQAYGPYLESPTRFREEFNAYMTLFTRGQEVARFTASDEHPGPELRILKVRP